MKYSIKIFGYLIILLTLVLFGCEDRTNLTEPKAPDTGNADFTTFVSIGNSLTAGYQNGSLYGSAQEYSFGNQIAQQVWTDCEQPLFDDTGTAGKMSLVTIDPLVINYSTESGNPINLNYPAPYNNLGIPGAFLWDVLNATDSTDCYTAQHFGSPNPLFDIVLRNSSLNIGSQFAQAKVLNPTFITLWIGNNDILGYASSGGTLPPYTPEADFTNLYNQLADSIATLNANVVVANIPSVTAIPFFTTIPPILPDSTGAYTIPVYGIAGDGATRMLVPGKDLLTLYSQEYLSQGVGISPDNPLPSSVILDSLEVYEVETVIADYNVTIETATTANNFVLVDIYTFFNEVATNGYSADGLDFTTAYIEGGLFSLDGVHPTSRGYAIVANKFIEKINAEFGASIPLINVSTVPCSLPLAGGV